MTFDLFNNDFDQWWVVCQIKACCWSSFYLHGKAIGLIEMFWPRVDHWPKSIDRWIVRLNLLIPVWLVNIAHATNRFFFTMRISHICHKNFRLGYVSGAGNFTKIKYFFRQKINNLKVDTNGISKIYWKLSFFFYKTLLANEEMCDYFLSRVSGLL